MGNRACFAHAKVEDSQQASHKQRACKYTDIQLIKMGLNTHPLNNIPALLTIIVSYWGNLTLENYTGAGEDGFVVTYPKEMLHNPLWTSCVDPKICATRESSKGSARITWFIKHFDSTRRKYACLIGCEVTACIDQLNHLSDRECVNGFTAKIRRIKLNMSSVSDFSIIMYLEKPYTSRFVFYVPEMVKVIPKDDEYEDMSQDWRFCAYIQNSSRLRIFYLGKWVSLWKVFDPYTERFVKQIHDPIEIKE